MKIRDEVKLVCSLACHIAGTMREQGAWLVDEIVELYLRFEEKPQFQCAEIEREQ